MVNEPPCSTLRAAPKKRFGLWSALASTPPERIFQNLELPYYCFALASLVIESNRITTFMTYFHHALCFSKTMFRKLHVSIGSLRPNVEEITSAFTERPYCHFLRSLIDQEDHQVNFRMIFGWFASQSCCSNTVLPVFGLCHDHSSLPFR